MFVDEWSIVIDESILKVVMSLFGQQDHVPDNIARRRELVFLVLAGIFLGSLTMLNILGISRFIDLSFNIGSIRVPFFIAVGVLAYPITFLCTDFISELFGRKRANMIVWVGLLLNVWVLFVLWLGGVLDMPENLTAEGKLPITSWKTIDGVLVPEEPDSYVFYRIRFFTFAGTAASMIAYLAAQFCDVHVFHYLKKITNGKHLWLRNNGSTVISQFVDSVAVILITYHFTNALGQPLEGVSVFSHLLTFILSSYFFKLLSALVDTLPFYLGVNLLSKYLRIDPNEEYLSSVD